MKSYLWFLIFAIILSGCAPRTTYTTEEYVPQVIEALPTAIVNDVIFAETKPIIKRKKTLIVIDPGHGGEDLGTEAPSKPPFAEKNLNLVTARMLKVFLQQMGYQTTMTRDDDTFVSLAGRAKLANDSTADLFVSVHFNSAPNPKAEGIEVFYFKSEENQKRSDASKLLAQKILNRLIINTEAKSRGVKHGNLAVIRKTGMPAVLVEGGFFTNEKELKNLKDGNYIKKLAWGIAQGIQEYLSNRD